MPKSWSMERERAYRALMQYLGSDRLVPTSQAMFDLHKRAVRILNEEEPDPRFAGRKDVMTQQSPEVLAAETPTDPMGRD